MNDIKYDGKYYKFRKVTDIKDLIDTSTELYPDHAAYLEKNRETGKFEPISYSKVKSDMNALGTSLIDLGMKGEKIAVIGETSYKWLLTYFTVVTGVGVIVPLDRNLPDGELRGLIERSGAAAIVYSGKARKAIEPLFDGASDSFGIKAFISMDLEADDEKELSLGHLIERGKDLLRGGNMEYMDASVDPDQMSTLLFTSGTTGAAKGVMLSHRNIASNCYEMSKFFRIPEPGIVLSILPVHHVYEMTCDILTTFYQGKTIAICEGIKYIQKNMVEVKANVMLGVPLVFEKMYKGMWKQAKKRGEDAKLRRAIDLSKRFKLYNNKTVIRRLFKAIHQSFGGEIQSFVVGGAAADPYIIEEFEAMGLPMIQGYGMSENAPIICLNPDRYRKADAVGKPLPGTKVRITGQDEDGIGEIIVKGPSVMLGYYENQEATEEAIRNGWLHTGDLGYIDDDGFIHITGRAKTVIVTKGGKNIFPEEVENVLLESDYIEEVIVHGVTDDRVGNVMIMADIYPNDETLKKKKIPTDDSSKYHFFRDLVEEINASMPPYKQVKRISVRKEPFVKTTTGKIKRFANKLSGQDAAGAGMDENEKKYIEERKAKDLVEQIKQGEARFVTCKDVRPITTVKDLIYTSADRFEELTACTQKIITKDKSTGYLHITYKQLIADMEGLGTALLNRNLGGKNIAILGHNCYRWQISYLTCCSGVGTSVPIECDLDTDELERRLREAGCEIAIFEAPLREKMIEIRSAGKTRLKVLIDYGEALGLGELHPGNKVTGGEADVAEVTKDAEKLAVSKHEDVADGEGDILYLPDLVEEGKQQVSMGDRQFIDKEISGDDVASIVYTSGATGTARRVTLTHTNIAFGVMSSAASIRIDPSDVIYSALPAHIMYEIMCGLLIPLYRGATCVSSRNGAYSGAGDVEGSAIAEAASASKMCEEMKEVSPSVLVLTPPDIRLMQKLFRDTMSERRGSNAIYSIMNVNRYTSKVGINIAKPFAGSARALVGGKVRLMITGGSKVSKATMEYMRAFGVTALQSYWLTECATVAAVDPEDHASLRFGSCGHIVPGMEVKVINRGRDGMGEICLRGENVMNDVYDGWLHTGDLGFIDEDNYIYITGRVEKRADDERLNGADYGNTGTGSNEQRNGDTAPSGDILTSVSRNNEEMYEDTSGIGIEAVVESKAGVQSNGRAVKEAAEDRRSGKEAARADKKAAQEQVRAEKKAAHEAAKAEKKAMKEAARAEKKAEKEALKEEKAAEKETKKAVKRAEKEAIRRSKDK